MSDPWLPTDDVRTAARELFDWFIAGGNVSDISAVVRRTAELIGTPISVEPAGDDRWEKLMGLTVAYLDEYGVPEKYGVLIRQQEIYYQIYCVLHELSHLLFGHPPSEIEAPQQLDVSERNGVLLHARFLVWDNEELTPAERRQEAEAEELARLLGTLVMHPRYRDGERTFG